MKALFLRLFYRYLMKPFLQVIVGVSFEGNEVFKKEKQFIIVANHNSHMDTAAILSSLPGDKLGQTHPTAAADHFKGINRIVTSVLFNAVFIRRGSIRSIHDMQVLLDSGKSLIVYPEGTRGRPEELSDFKRGVAVLLKKNPEIPYIPIFLTGMGKIMPKDEGLVVPFNSKLIVGKAKRISSSESSEIMNGIYKDIVELKENSNLRQ